MPKCRMTWLALAAMLAAAGGSPALADDQPQWGQRHTRNMVSKEKPLPESFDPKTGANIKWSVRLGTQTYSTPVIAGGKIFIGTNNERPRDPRHKGDRGVLMCLDEKDGSLLWQLVVPKLEDDRYLDWPKAGISSPVTVEGDRVYAMTNRNEAVCLDIRGMANGNDGPYKDEGKHMALRGRKPMKPAKTDADILWLFDLIGQAGVYQNDATHSSILLHNRLLYINTSNGNDNTHKRNPAPDAPSLIVLDKTTGRIVARDHEGIGHRIYHCTWSSPALGEVGGRPLIFFGGGDGVVYAFEALKGLPPAGKVQKLKRVWRFDCDPTAPKTDIHKYKRNREVSPSNIKGMPVFHNGRVYVTVGGDIWWGKNKAWLKCIDASKTGDITKSGLIWSYDLNRHACTTPAIQDGLIFVADCGRTVHCVDAKTGKAYWTQETKGPIWASTLVADGKVYVGTQRGDFWIFAASKEKKVLGKIDLGAPISSTPVAANGVLYVTTHTHLYAVSSKTPKKP